MRTADIVKMVEGLSELTKNMIVTKLRPSLSTAINEVNILAKTDPTEIYPPADKILAAFKICSFESIKVVLLGQDPYIKPGEAMGLSFSVPKGIKVPPSLKNIYKCLMHNNLLAADPGHGDLTTWAEQGVLLLNCSLTVFKGKSNTHSKCWSKYTDDILRTISDQPGKIIFIMLGADAKKKVDLIDQKKHIILQWGHPSPLNTQNKSDNPLNFQYCDVFNRTNDILTAWGKTPINWQIEKIQQNQQIMLIQQRQQIQTPVTLINVRQVDGRDPVPIELDTIWVFTDGGSQKNGDEKCEAAWGFYITDGTTCVESYGLVLKTDIPGKAYKTSNNRGELTAILEALKNTLLNIDQFAGKKVILITDSQYSMNSIDVWYNSWIADPVKLEGKMNLDLIGEAKGYLDEIRKKMPVNLQHMRSHRKEPEDCESREWFFWKCNDLVDKLCNLQLRG